MVIAVLGYLVLFGVTSPADGASGVPVVTVTMNKHSIVLSTGLSISAGYTIFRVVHGDAGSHELQLFRLRGGYTLKNLKADIVPGVAAASNPAATRRVYRGVDFLGGAISGRFAETLRPGRYFLMDIGGGRRNYTRLTVHGQAPTHRSVDHDGTIVGHDMTFSASHGMRSDGWTIFRNAGHEPHTLSMTRVKRGTTRRQVRRFLHCQTCGNPGFALSGHLELAAVSPGAQVVFHHSLPPGKYLMLCFMPDPDHHDLPHALEGMFSFVRWR